MRKEKGEWINGVTKNIEENCKTSEEAEEMRKGKWIKGNINEYEEHEQ